MYDDSVPSRGPRTGVASTADGGGDVSVGEAAQITGLSAHTLRYYERVGLLTAPRTATGQRRYGPRELLALEFISRLRATGMPIAQVKEYADAARADRGREVGLPLLLAHRRQLLLDLEQRREALAAIDRKIRHYRTT